MVCSIGNGRMAVMARLLVAGRLSQNIAEEVSQQKFVTRYNCRELHESDEPNLLDEEDMHVFGLMPMADPLDLVCCNACKKPVMASQYAAHAELCRLLNSTEEMTLELDGAIGCRKPPRKERKKLLTASSSILYSSFLLLAHSQFKSLSGVHSDQATSFGERERSETIVADDSVASELQLDGQPRVPSHISLDKKRGRNKGFYRWDKSLFNSRRFEAAGPASFILLKLVALSRSYSETRKMPRHSNSLFGMSKSQGFG
ncbi:hypothetical protein SADUNF_Sadunf08G0160800 [Salix dunnii]|uniref:SAGA-associated factor 11 n=1 Tax=Salix dunnii TaxID=1413687 RepID=A0A835MYC4_9ROSI|nr:hypothetical protein SADUNF_Sadunf08G0160800 [Salix dunnii]